MLMDDQPGGLHAIAASFAAKGINIDDAYGFVIQDKKRAVMILDVEGIPQARKVLTDANLPGLNDDELYNL